MLLRNKSFITCLCILTLSSVSLIAHISSKRGASSATWVPNLKGHHVDQCPDELDWLGGLNLVYPIRYAHRDIIVNPRPEAKRASISKLDEPLFPGFQTIDLTKDTTVELQHCLEPLVLDVPAIVKDSGDAAHIMFGISTTIQRLDDSIPQLLRWLPHTNARMFVIAIESEQHDEVKAVAADPARMHEVQSRMRGLGMDVTLVDPLVLQESFSEKYFSLIKVMYNHRNDKTKWISTIDDDTFFPSMSALVSMLRKYDPLEQYYVGALSENWWAVTHYGMMGFGGAGVFLSLAMAKVINENYDFCKESSHTTAGDIRILECVYGLTSIKLTNERDLHQVDIWSDLSGVFESGRQLLSFHHWKPGAANTEGYNMPMLHTVADVCGDCFLQRWQFGGDMVLTNGYSIAYYPKGDLKGANMEQMEETWDKTTEVEGSVNHGTDHSLGPTRRRLKLDDEKIQYVLIDSAVVDGGVRQSYLHSGKDGDIDSLLELFWLEGKEDEVRPLDT